MPNKDELSFHLPHPAYDTHFHALVMEERGINAAAAISAAFRAGLVGAIDVAVDETEFSRRLEFAGGFDGIRLSAGIHPSYLADGNGEWEDRFAVIRGQASDPSVVAIGETGLDFYRDRSPRDAQETAFRDHLDLAEETGKPVIIHNRNADERVLAVVGESKCRFGVFHCFSSEWETAKKALNLGFFISFAGNLTYKKADDLRDAAARVPDDRILVETDAPFLSPQPVRGRLNHPGHIGHTLAALAEIRRTDPSEIAGRTVENAVMLSAGA